MCRGRDEKDREKAKNKYDLCAEVHTNPSLGREIWSLGEAFRGHGHGTSPLLGLIAQSLRRRDFGVGLRVVKVVR
jgi:hypothetical protein